MTRTKEKEVLEKAIPQSGGEVKKKKPRPTDKNLIPICERSPEEVRRMRQNGGKKSGEVRRAQKEAKEALKKAPSDVVGWLYSLEPDSKTKEALSEKLGIPIDEINSVERVSAVSMYNQVRKGNVKAFEALERKKSSNNDSSIREQELKLKKEELKLKKEKHAQEMKELEEKTGNNLPEYRGIGVLDIAPNFAAISHDIERHGHTEYLLQGGRGSTKSSFISLEIIHLMKKYPDLNALVLRQVGNTLRGSVYNQMLWAIDQLGLTSEFKPTTSTCEITLIATGQKIFFRGADDPGKIKSIKPARGYIGIVWLEELDQFSGPESVRKIEQSTMRGGDLAWVFKSFNPPKSALNWANKYALVPKENRLVNKSDYRTVPKEWLGKTWLEEAEWLKQLNPIAYDNEYLGIANGTGGAVFDNVTIKELQDDEVNNFDRIYQGVDWGWYPDPFHYSRCHYDAARMTLYIFGEYRANKQSNLQTAETVKALFDVSVGIIECDSAEEKSVSDWREYDMPARGVVKGPGSVDYSMKWLQSLKSIVIDPVRAPHTAEEFTNYEYERDRDGNVISGYPDRDNHAIDSVRYAMYPVWKKRGQ